MPQEQFWIISGTFFYMIVMIGIGFWTNRFVKDTNDYLVAGRRLSFGLSLGTIFATWFGAETCMGSANTAYKEGILGVIADPFGAGLCLVLAGIFFVKQFYKFKIKTIIDFFEIKFGREVAKIFSFFYLPVYIGWVGAQMLAFGTILNLLTGLPQDISILISAIVVTFYTYSGGMWAVAMTDFIQAGIIIVSFIFVFFNISKTFGGLETIFQKIDKEMFRFFPKENNFIPWLKYLESWTIVGLGSLGAQDLIGRLVAAKNARIAQWSSIIGGIMYWVVGLMPVMLGIFATVLLKEFTNESVLISLSIKYLPIPLMSLMVGGLLSAIMSSVDSAMLAPSSIIGNNLIPYFIKDFNEKQKLFWCKISVPIIGFGSLLMALHFKNIYNLCLESWSILLTSITAPLIFATFWKRTTSFAAILSSITGFLAWILGNIFLESEFPTRLAGFIVSCITIFVASIFSKKE